MKRLALYPFLFVLYIILSPLDHNLDQLDPSQAFRPLIVLFLAVACGQLLFYLFFKDWQYASYLVFLVILYFFFFRSLNRLVQDILSSFDRVLDEEIFLAIYTGLFGILVFKGVWSRLRARNRLVIYLNLLFILWLLFPLYGLFSGTVFKTAQARSSSEQTLPSIGELVVDCSNSPDIYYIILDGYGRADMLEDLYGLDNQSFLAYLRNQGFYVADESYTNYIQTQYSIPSGLNFNFIDLPGEDTSGQMYISDLMRRNNIMTVLERCGYQTVSIESGYFFTDHLVVDFYLSHGIGTNEFESLLLADSPVDVLAEELELEYPRYSYEAHRQRVLNSFEQLETLYQMPGPKFVFAHIISPHPPFVFDQYGQTVEQKHRYYIGDGDDFLGSLEEYLSGYPAQVQFVNQKMEHLIDAILGNSSSPPVIIIQGDHGPGSRLVWESPERTCLWERTPILNAYYLPGDWERFLYPSISPVNSFRVILNAYFGTDLPFLPDATYFTSHDPGQQAIDITRERSSRTNCYSP